MKINELVMTYKPSKKGLKRGLVSNARVIKLIIDRKSSKLWFKYEDDEYSFLPADADGRLKLILYGSKVDSLWVEDKAIDPSIIKGKNYISEYNLNDKFMNILKNLRIL
jgi:hypothetical protein